MSTAEQFAPSTSVVEPSTNVGYLWTKRQVAQFLNISVASVDRWVSVPGVDRPRFLKIGDLVRFDPADIRKFVAARKK